MNVGNGNNGNNYNNNSSSGSSGSYDNNFNQNTSNNNNNTRQFNPLIEYTTAPLLSSIQDLICDIIPVLRIMEDGVGRDEMMLTRWKEERCTAKRTYDLQHSTQHHAQYQNQQHTQHNNCNNDMNGYNNNNVNFSINNNDLNINNNHYANNNHNNNYNPYQSQPNVHHNNIYTQEQAQFSVCPVPQGFTFLPPPIKNATKFSDIIRWRVRTLKDVSDNKLASTSFSSSFPSSSNSFSSSSTLLENDRIDNNGNSNSTHVQYGNNSNKSDQDILLRDDIEDFYD